MKKSIFLSRLIASILATGVLLYFMTTTKGPKVIFVPFFICSLSMAGQAIAWLFNREKWAVRFHKLFVAGFLLFWFGLLTVTAYLCIRDKNYLLMMFSIPFWAVGIYLAKKKLLP